MRTKAKRGALLHHPPRGSVRGPEGDSQRDPEAQAQRVGHRICDVCAPPGRLQGVRRSLGAHDLRGPMRPHCGRNRGPLEWQRPPRMP
jgi:hypothetical protein